MSRRGRRGFTLIEITVALAVGGMALSAAAALLGGLSERAREIRSVGARVDRDGNAERLLRGLVGNLRSTDSALTLSGDSGSVVMQSWCEGVEGWLRPCRAHLAIERDTAGFHFRLELASGETRSMVFWRRERGPAGIRYLRDASYGGTWVTRWTDKVAPAAIAAFAGADTLVLATW